MLKRRQYVLIVLIIAIGGFNLWRGHRAKIQPVDHTIPEPAMVVHGTSPAWAVYDNAASLRDASGPQFEPALKSLNAAIDNTNATAIPPQTPPAEITDLHGCQTWLMFYRQEHLYPTTRPGWAAETKGHVDSCAANHRDISK
jgi:hypothetical protein